MNSEKNNSTPLMKEKKNLRSFAMKIKHVPTRFTDDFGRISDTKILQCLIEYHQGRI